MSAKLEATFSKAFFCLCLGGALSACTLNTSLDHVQAFSRSLSLQDPHFKTCIFSPLARVVHFPMWHFPSTGHYCNEEKERAVRSQFQLLHTILDYRRFSRNVLLFDEHVAYTDRWNEVFFEQLSALPLEDPNSREYYWERTADKRRFYDKEEMEKTKQAFAGGWPRHYENLSVAQKDILFNLGAGLTLYLSGEIPRLHKVINQQSYGQVVARVPFFPGAQLDGTRDYWVFDFRELALQREVKALQARNNAARNLFLIAFGADHDFSQVFSAEVPPFESGHDFCVAWEQQIPSCGGLLP